MTSHQFNSALPLTAGARTAVRECALAARAGRPEHESAMDSLKARYALDVPTAVRLGEAAGTCPEALKLLDEGFPVEYVLAMGGGQ